MTVATAAAARSRTLASAPFALFFGAQTATVAAEMFSYVALSWVTLQLTGSGAAVGAVLASQAVPRAVLMLVGGAISDRLTPVRVMLGGAVARAAVLGTFAALLVAGRAQAWEVFVVAAALGVIGAFFYPARSSALPSLVEAELIQSANAWVFLATQAAATVGPAVAGLVVARAGSGAAFAVDAGGFAIAAVALLPIRQAGGSVERKPSAGLLADVVAGLRYMWESPLTRAILAVIVVLNFAVNGPFEVGVAVLARQAWGGPLALGGVIGAFGIGSVFGALAVRKLRLPLGWALVAVCVAFGLGFPLIGLFGVPWPAALVTALIGVVNACVNVLGLTWLQTRTPPELIGRVMSVVMTGAMAVGPFSFLIAGALVAINVELPFALTGVLSLLAAVFTVRSRTVREAR